MPLSKRCRAWSSACGHWLRRSRGLPDRRNGRPAARSNGDGRIRLAIANSHLEAPARLRWRTRRLLARPRTLLACGCRPLWGWGVSSGPGVPGCFPRCALHPRANGKSTILSLARSAPLSVRANPFLVAVLAWSACALSAAVPPAKEIKDLAFAKQPERARGLFESARPKQGPLSPEWLEAMSWVGRAGAIGGDWNLAAEYSERTLDACEKVLKTEPLVHIFETFRDGWDFDARVNGVVRHFRAWKARQCA